jgi:hypothetical protein
MALFSNTNGLDPSRRLPYLPSNFRGDLQISVCKHISGEKGQAFVAEFKILSSNLPAVEVGSEYSWYQKIEQGKRSETGARAVIGLLYALMGLDPARDAVKIEKEIKPQQDSLLNSLVDEIKNPAAGAKVHVQTLAKPLRDDPSKVFTVHTFSPYVAPYVAA